MAKRTLRVCLAMGGGVSLGSYSGAGLTEALKLLILYGQNKNEEPYEDIIVDGMSGASAGAISLGILLRCLVDYESMMQTAGFENKTKILKQIKEDYNYLKIGDLNTAKREALCAIEVAQKIQHLIWVKKVTAEGLYGEKTQVDFKVDMNEPFGILERKSLESLARQLILPNKGFDSSRRALLDSERVIFALSLTNLISMPVGYDSVGQDIQEKNLLRSTASSNHAELRVIDFVFKENSKKPSDDRWVKFVKKPQKPVDNRMFYDLDKQHAWATLTASTLACGAFPIAFAPVMLKRFKKEYDSSIFEEGVTNLENRKTSWPGGLMQIHNAIKSQSQGADFTKNSFFAERNDNILDYSSFNFAYIDGGTFNNEPIKEAFKIASFQDFRRDTSEEDRLVLFIDPIVRKGEFKSFRIDSYAPVKTDYETFDTTIKGELGKLFGIIDPLLGALVDQGSIKEDQKIVGVNESLGLREILFDYLDKFSVTFDERLIVYAYYKIRNFLDEDMISIGTRDGHQYILDAIEKECKEAIRNDKSLEYLNSFKKDLSFLFKTKENTASQFLSIDRLPNNLYLSTLSELNAELKDPEKAAKYNEIITRAVFKVLADLALGTAGKNQLIDKRVILPVTSDGKNIVDLPGHHVAAFAGFASDKSKEYAFEYARLNAAMTLAIPRKNQMNQDNESANAAYLSEAIAKTLQNKSIERLRKTGFYNPKSNYDLDLKQRLISPGIDRLFTVLKTFSSSLKKPSTALLGMFAFLLSLLGFLNKVLNKIKKSVKERANTLADDTNYLPLKPITISIVSEKPIEVFKKRKIKISTDHNGIFDLKVFQNKNRKELLFTLYVLKTSSDQNSTIFSLTASRRIKLPTKDEFNQPVDPNIDPIKWDKVLKDAAPPKVNQLQLNKNGNAISMNFLDNKEQSLYYSIWFSQFHINPLLKYNLDTKAWSFVENTKSFDKKMMEND